MDKILFECTEVYEGVRVYFIRGGGYRRFQKIIFPRRLFLSLFCVVDKKGDIT